MKAIKVDPITALFGFIISCRSHLLDKKMNFVEFSRDGSEEISSPRTNDFPISALIKKK